MSAVIDWATWLAVVRAAWWRAISPLVSVAAVVTSGIDGEGDSWAGFTLGRSCEEEGASSKGGSNEC